MSSFKEAHYEHIKIFGQEGLYTKDRIEDELPEGFYKYHLMLNGEHKLIIKDTIEDFDATLVTKDYLPVSDGTELNDTDLVFGDNKFYFENFFNGIHRPIDFQINVAEAKKNEQLQDKSRSKTKDISPEVY